MYAYKEGNFKSYILVVNDLYQTFLCKVMIKNQKITMHKIEPENNKMAPMMEFRPHWNYKDV